jgi:hypothetical protein
MRPLAQPAPGARAGITHARSADRQTDRRSQGHLQEESSMSGFQFVPASRRVRLLLKIVMFGAAALAFGACSSGAPVQAQDDNAVIGIQTSQLSVEIVNRVGMPLTDVDVSIVPVGGATEFKKFVGRMENAEKKDIALGGFFGRDGTTFNLRVVKPRAVRVTGKDLTGKAYTIESAWR